MRQITYHTEPYAPVPICLSRVYFSGTSHTVLLISSREKCACSSMTRGEDAENFSPHTFHLLGRESKTALPLKRRSHKSTSFKYFQNKGSTVVNAFIDNAKPAEAVKTMVQQKL